MKGDIQPPPLAWQETLGLAHTGLQIGVIDWV
jgi:hypothetical protein